MKKQYIIFYILPFFFLYCCQSRKNSNDKPISITLNSSDSLNIHFLSGFNNDSIYIENNNKIFRGLIKTIPSLGFAFQKKYDPKYVRRLKITVQKGDANYNVVIDSIKTNYLAIWYTRSHGLQFEFETIPFKYE